MVGSVVINDRMSTAQPDAMLSFDPAKESPSDIYKLMVGAIVPRPIAFVSSMDKDGVLNLAPFSYFSAVCSNPPTVLFCPAVRTGSGETKDTLRNIIATEEFVINVVSEDIAAQMNQCAAEVAPEVDEFALSGLTPIASEVVRPPRVAESPVQLECSLREILTISDQPGGASIVIGNVARFHVRKDLLNGFRIDPDKLRAIGRMGGATYTRTVNVFDLQRPR